MNKVLFDFRTQRAAYVYLMYLIIYKYYLFARRDTDITTSKTSNVVGYDGLYRLTGSSATEEDRTSYPSGNDIVRGYDLSMAYDNLHNITDKNQTVYDIDTQDMTTKIADAAYTYDNHYTYNSSYVLNGTTKYRCLTLI